MHSSHVVLIDFSAAHFFGPALTVEGRAQFLAATGHTIEQVAQYYELREVNTASDAVLRTAAAAAAFAAAAADVPAMAHAFPSVTVTTLPLDEACSIIYLALQVNFPESSVAAGIGYASNSSDFVERRARWARRFDQMVAPKSQLEALINTINNNLRRLGEHRADNTLSTV